MTALSSRSSESSRAARSAWIVGGIVTSGSSAGACQRSSTNAIRPSSIIIERSCSTKSGFPSAATTIRRRTMSSRPASPSRFWTILSLSSALNGSSTIWAAFGSFSQSGRCSRRIGRASQSRTIGASPSVSVRFSTRSRKDGFRPVEILEDHDDRTNVRQEGEELANAPKELLDGELCVRQADRGSDPLHHVGVPGTCEV